MEALPSLSRRGFLGTAAGAGALLAERALFGGETDAIDVNAELRAIPEGLPHVKEVKKFLTEGASFGLVGVTDVHWSNEQTLKVAMEVERCQKRNRELIEALLEKKLLDTLYVEGMPAEGEPPFDPAYFVNVSAKDQNFIGIDRIAEIGAARMLAEEKKLKVRGAERTATWDASGTVMDDDAYSRRWRKLVLEDRENALLDVITKERRRIAWTFFGCWHDWENNVKEWNEKHPDARFSYVSLLTASGEEYLRRYPRPQGPLPPLPTPPPPTPKPGEVIFRSDKPKKKPIEPFIDLDF